MGWIKTKNKMPPNDTGEWVLFIFEDEVKMGSFDSYPSGAYWVDVVNIRYHPDRVYYWMPIPKLPKEVVDD